MIDIEQQEIDTWRDRLRETDRALTAAARARIDAFVRNAFAMRDARRQLAALDPVVGDPVCSFLVARYGVLGGVPCAS